MYRQLFARVSLALAAASVVQAEYTDFFFPSAPDHSKASCPGMFYSCVPPRVCAHSQPFDIYYCCVPGSKDEVCHTSAQTCQGGEGVPDSTQNVCGSGDNKYCCLKDAQKCTQRTNQINICWSTDDNPVALLDADRLNDTYSSMSSANPSATSYSIALAQLQTLTTQTPGASSAPSGQSSTGSNTAGTTPPPSSTSGSGQGSNSNETTNNSDGLSTGAKAGIAVGVVAVVGIIGLGAFLLWRRKKNKTAGNPYTQGPPAELHNTQAPVESPAAEKYARYTAEMPAPQPTYEMPGEPYRDHR